VKGENYMANDLHLVQDIYEQTLAVLNDRYGKKISYIQSLPVIVNLNRDGAQDAANCPLLQN